MVICLPFTIERFYLNCEKSEKPLESLCSKDDVFGNKLKEDTRFAVSTRQ